MGSPARRLVLRAALLLVPALFVPALWCGRDARRLYSGDRELQLALSREVARSVASGVDPSRFHTGSSRFDGEWTVGTHQMAVLGLAQVATEHPELRVELLPAVDAAVGRLLEPETRAFGTRAWGEDGLEALGSRNGHAYLGYVNLALGADRMLRPESPYAAVHDRLTATLAGRLGASPTGMIETYPGETYPPDVSAVAASIGLHDRATGRGEHRELLDRWGRMVRQRYVDPESGLLVQSVRGADGAPLDSPRASGTALAAYFLSFSDPALSASLYVALERNQGRCVGFGGIREYPPLHAEGGHGDIDSGPVIFGVGLSATGFSISSARIHGDEGVGNRRFVTGGPLGNSIMLAMLTAGPLAASEPA